MPRRTPGIVGRATDAFPQVQAHSLPGKSSTDSHQPVHARSRTASCGVGGGGVVVVAAVVVLAAVAAVVVLVLVLVRAVVAARIRVLPASFEFPKTPLRGFAPRSLCHTPTHRHTGTRAHTHTCTPEGHRDNRLMGVASLALPHTHLLVGEWD